VVGVAGPAAGGAATGAGRPPLWQLARRNGIAYGTSTTTWQLVDQPHAALVAREAALLFTEDDLLWWLKPTPDSPLDFSFADQFMAFAERHGMAVLGAHLVWDEGFGEGWTEDDLWGWSARRRAGCCSEPSGRWCGATEAAWTPGSWPTR
jgi:endo-1,4-beta-xylanase